jgi:hypothetical protein
MSGGQRLLKGAISSSPLRPDGSCNGQAGRLDCVSDGQRHSK